MKKFTLLAILVIMAMVLAACAPADTEPGDVTPGFETTEPGIPGTGDETPAPGLGTTEPIATPTVVLTDEVTPEVTQVLTPTLQATPVTGMVDGDGLADDHPARATVLIGMDVENTQGEDLGEINDLIVDLEQEKVTYAIIGVGGVLGIGERNVAVPFEMLTIQPHPDDADDWVVILDVDEEAFENAPDVDLDDIDFTLPDWDIDFRDGFTVSVTVQATPAATVAATPAATMAATPAATVTGMTGTEPLAIRMSVLLDSDVDTRDIETVGTVDTTATATPAAGTTAVVVDWEDIGDIQEVLIDIKTGDVLYIVVDPDDALDLDEVWIPVPMSSVEIIHDPDRDWVGGDYLVILVERDQLVSAPAFEAGILPAMDLPDWDADFRIYWDVR